LADIDHGFVNPEIDRILLCPNIYLFQQTILGFQRQIAQIKFSSIGRQMNPFNFFVFISHKTDFQIVIPERDSFEFKFAMGCTERKKPEGIVLLVQAKGSIFEGIIAFLTNDFPLKKTSIALRLDKAANHGQ
jgi:hypothetical protein